MARSKKSGVKKKVKAKEAKAETAMPESTKVKPVVDKNIVVALLVVAAVVFVGLFFVLSVEEKEEPPKTMPVVDFVPVAGAKSAYGPVPTDSVFYMWADAQTILAQESVRGIIVPSYGGMTYSETLDQYENETGLDLREIDTFMVFMDTAGEAGILAEGTYNIDVALEKLGEYFSFGDEVKTSTYKDHTIRTSEYAGVDFLFLDKETLLLATSYNKEGYVNRVIDVWDGSAGNLFDDKDIKETLDKAGSGLLKGVIVTNDEVKEAMEDSLSLAGLGLVEMGAGNVIAKMESISFAVQNDRSKIVIMTADAESAEDLKAVIDAGLAFLKVQWEAIEQGFESEVEKDEQIVMLGTLIDEFEESTVYTEGKYLLMELTVGLDDIMWLTEMYLALSQFSYGYGDTAIGYGDVAPIRRSWLLENNLHLLLNKSSFLQMSNKFLMHSSTFKFANFFAIFRQN